MESIIKNETVFERLQEKERRDRNVKPRKLHLLPDEFAVITDILTILKPVREAQATVIIKCRID